MLKDVVRYELPPEGITLLGYVVRRMHKTEWLQKAHEFLESDLPIKALEAVAVYAAASSTSFGRAYYQPMFNSKSESVQERDPITGAEVTATLESISPHYKISYQVNMPNQDIFSGREEITGTTVGLRGLGMPAPSTFNFTSGNYQIDFVGLLTSELALSFFGNTRIRAYGFLNIKDTLNNTAKLELNRQGELKITINHQPPLIHSLINLIWQDPV